MQGEKKIVLIVEYDGSSYQGYQIQKNKPTIQLEIEKAIKMLTQEQVSTVASSRTDSGVHALEQVVCFNTKSNIPPERFHLAMNTKLPRDIRVRKSYMASEDFHPRYDVSSKTYRYLTILCKPDYFGEALLRNRANFECCENIRYHDKMVETSKLLIGKQDYASFCSAGSSVKTTVRDVKRLDLYQETFLDINFLVFEIEADGFLYNMVRIISNVLLLVGKGKLEIEDVKRIIEAKNRNVAPPPAPPQGLYLAKVSY